MKVNTLYLSRTDRSLIATVRLCAATASILTLLIFIFLLFESVSFLRNISPALLFDSQWFPSEGKYGVGGMVAGSLAVVAGSLIIASPLAIAVAFFHHFAAKNWVTTLSRRLLETMVGIPSVVYGFWGLVVLVPRINEINPPGQSLLAASIIVAMMILPTIAMVLDSALETMPKDLRLGAAALGLSTCSTIFQVVWPKLRPSLVAAFTLGGGRALGETMAVAMVAGNIVQIPSSVFDPVRTLTANIALEMSYATGAHRSSLFVSGLALLLVSAIFASIANTATVVKSAETVRQ